MDKFPLTRRGFLGLAAKGLAVAAAATIVGPSLVLRPEYYVKTKTPPPGSVWLSNNDGLWHYAGVLSRDHEPLLTVTRNHVDIMDSNRGAPACVDRIYTGVDVKAELLFSDVDGDVMRWLGTVGPRPFQLFIHPHAKELLGVRMPCVQFCPDERDLILMADGLRNFQLSFDVLERKPGARLIEYELSRDV